jgi:hypothetical protein
MLPQMLEMAGARCTKQGLEITNIDPQEHVSSLHSYASICWGTRHERMKQQKKFMDFTTLCTLCINANAMGTAQLPSSHI